jgi:hypothetical protein
VRDGAEQGAANFLLTRAPQSDETKQFALTNIEIDRPGARGRQAPRNDASGSWSAVGLVEQFERRAADNEAHQFVQVGLAHWLLTDEPEMDHNLELTARPSNVRPNSGLFALAEPA